MSYLTFPSVYREVYEDGIETDSRAGKVRRKLNTVVVFTFGETYVRKGANPAIGLIEGLQFLAGTASLDAIAAVAPKVDLKLFGANSFYGPRTRLQFNRVIDELRSDRYSRRAVITVINPEEYGATMPCTTTLQFQVHNDWLFTSITMRSSDLVWGLPYDMIQFGMVAKAMASCLGIGVGPLTLFAGNAHIYVSTAVKPDDLRLALWDMPVQFDEWGDWAAWAKQIVASNPRRSTLLDMFSLHRVEE